MNIAMSHLSKFCACALSLAMLAGTASSTQANQLDPNVAEDAIKIMRKMTCGSLVDEKKHIAYWEGQTYSRVPGEKDRLLFKVFGINTRQCTTRTDEERGEGFQSVSREVMFYLDAESGEILRTWENPFTGETNDVIHVANDPVNMRAPWYPYGKDGKPFTLKGKIVGDQFITTSETPLFYTNPLGGKFQKYVGGEYQAIEMFNNFADAETLLDRDEMEAPRGYLSWARMSQWLPWMEMGSRPGQLIIHTHGYHIEDESEIPNTLLDEVKANYPEYLSPPPMDDKRPNETSWTYFKKVLTERMEKNAAAE